MGPGELLELEQRQLIIASIKGEPVQLTDMAALGDAYVAIRLTIRGDAFVDCPPNRVIRALANQNQGLNHGLPVGRIRQLTDVDDGVLRDMEDAGLVQVLSHDGAPLAAFRKIPKNLVLRLSLSGRSYAAL